jgi:hypothetical protein
MNTKHKPIKITDDMLESSLTSVSEAKDEAA